MNTKDLKKKKVARHFFENEYPSEIEKLYNLSDLETLKSTYKSLSEQIETFFYQGYYGEWIQTQHMFMHDEKVKKSFHRKLKLAFLEKLKELEVLSPYKIAISEAVEIHPGYTHHASAEFKDFVDEWDLYTKERPEIYVAINRKANFSLHQRAEFRHRDYFFLFPKLNLTRFGYDHMSEVLESFELLVRDREYNKGRSLLEEFSKKYNPTTSKYSRKPEQFPMDIRRQYPFPFWNFYQMRPFDTEVKKIIREAENLARVELKLPKVNEGWVSETKLYNEISTHFKNRKVIHHARLPFLNKQHLDIYIPSLKVALEYQGLQHDQPVEFFGGSQAFVKTQERDKRKFNLCNEQGIELIYVREGYVLDEVIQEIIRCGSLST